MPNLRASQVRNSKFRRINLGVMTNSREDERSFYDILSVSKLLFI